MRTLLAIVEQGGYPDFTSLYESLGYKVITASSMRKALGLLKQHKPDAITAEFIYSPMYSARISNLESLFAALQKQKLTPHLCIFIEKEHLHHLQKLVINHAHIHTFTYPINRNELIEHINRPSPVNEELSI